jgi:hypothetical protein
VCGEEKYTPPALDLSALLEPTTLLAETAEAGGEVLLSAAEQHGNDSDPEHETGDLQDYLRAALSLFTRQQWERYCDLKEVKNTLAAARGEDALT